MTPSNQPTTRDGHPADRALPLLFGLLASLAFALGGCASDATDVGGAECSSDLECGAGQACRSGRCINQPCGEGPPCTDGQSCLGGQCVDPQSRCRSDDDCPGGRCVDGECFANECEEGQEQPCENECGAGVQRCVDGVFRPCSARASSEVCDGRDNDCDGNADELLDCTGCNDGGSRDCMTECGSGQEQCIGGSWRGCDAPRPRIEICGNGIDEDCDATIDEGCDGCADGEQRDCMNECGVGTETCEGMTFRGCDAPTPIDELCDGQDNDCDGNIDEELVRDCNNACGPGVETCAEGQWMGCSAPQNCACDDGVPSDIQICGACGFRTRECSGGMWGEWGSCDEADVQCRPGESELGPCGNCGDRRRQCTAECRWGDWGTCGDEGVCAAGTEETQACENGCGDQARICNDMCAWTEWTACDGGGGGLSCSPGDVEEEPCGNCGVRRRTCAEGCTFGEWGECESEGPCAPGDEESQACDAATAQSRTCNDQCQWGEFGECSGDQCQPGEVQEDDCGDCGTRRRTCTPARIWGDWSPCQGEGVCSPGAVDDQACGSDVGQCQQGVATRTCNAQCRWSEVGPCRDAVGPADEICGNRLDEDCDGDVERDPDLWEPNDSCGSCYLLEMGEPDPNIFLDATIDAFNDSDYYCFVAEDGFNVPGFGEHIRISLTNIPAGNDYDVWLYRSAADCRADNALESSLNGGNADEEIDWSEALNSDDGGTYVIKVRSLLSHHSCRQGYRLTVDGLN